MGNVLTQVRNTTRTMAMIHCWQRRNPGPLYRSCPIQCTPAIVPAGLGMPLTETVELTRGTCARAAGTAVKLAAKVEQVNSVSFSLSFSVAYCERERRADNLRQLPALEIQNTLASTADLVAVQVNLI